MKNNSLLYLSFVIAFFFSTQNNNAQNNDAAFWENICLQKKVTSNTTIHFNQEGRINQNITRFYYNYADIGISYKFNKHISLMCDYVFIQKKKQTDFWSIHHQAYIGLTLKKKVGSFTISDRIMSEIVYSEIYSSEDGMKPNYHLRNKITVKYNHYSRYTYYIASELYYKINMPKGRQLDRMRYFAGIFYELNKINEIELYYLYENNFNTNNPINNSVIGIGYEHTF
jgi:hypothetical protein